MHVLVTDRDLLSDLQAHKPILLVIHTANRSGMDARMIRPAQVEDAAAMARVHVDTWRTSYPGIVPAEHLANLSYERAQAGWLENLANPEGGTHAFVAEGPSRQIVAIASCGPARDTLDSLDGELYVLYVLKAFQGMGYGRLLVKQAAEDLAGRGFHSLVIWVLKENPARGFYERLGGRMAGEMVVEIGGKELVDVAYGWPDLGLLAQAGFAGAGSTK
jgi:ribosomal protein S18 acetylase RimI-like enzyme